MLPRFKQTSLDGCVLVYDAPLLQLVMRADEQSRVVSVQLIHKAIVDQPTPACPVLSQMAERGQWRAFVDCVQRQLAVYPATSNV